MTVKESSMSSQIEENKALIRRFFNAIESGNLQVLDEIVVEGYDDHLAGQTPGRETLKKYFAALRSAFPDLTLPISAIVAEGDRVAVLNSIRGTHKGEFIGLKPSGRSIDAMAFQLYRIENGQLAEHWEVADFALLMRQLSGLILRWRTRVLPESSFACRPKRFALKRPKDEDVADHHKEIINCVAIAGETQDDLLCLCRSKRLLFAFESYLCSVAMP
jgi:steroid delta-isomerase-like uncharacterized protein